MLFHTVRSAAGGRTTTEDALFLARGETNDGIAIFAAATLLMLALAAAQDKATIEKLNDTFVSAFNTGDFAAVGTMYAEDAIALPPGSPP